MRQNFQKIKRHPQLLNNFNILTLDNRRLQVELVFLAEHSNVITSAYIPISLLRYSVTPTQTHPFELTTKVLSKEIFYNVYRQLALNH